MSLYRNVLPTMTLLMITSVISIQVHAVEDQKQSDNRADNAGSSDSQNEQGIRSLDEWNYQALYEKGGLRAENLLDAKAFSPEGKEIGEMANLVLDQESQIVTIIAEVGGQWDVGDRHVAVPWEETEIFNKGVKIPVRPDNLEEYELFSNVNISEAYIDKHDMNRVVTVEEHVATGPMTWKITDVINDYVSMKDGEGYGYIEDALFSRNGAVQAIIVMPASAGLDKGPRAYPFHGYPEGWRAGDTHYVLPYSRKDVDKTPVFEYEKYNSVLNTES